MLAISIYEGHWKGWAMNWDFFGSWNGKERNECHLGPKKVEKNKFFNISLQKHTCARQRRYFKSCKEPRNRFQGIDSASLCSLADWYDKPNPTRFLAPIECSKIPAQNKYIFTCWYSHIYTHIQLWRYNLFLHPYSLAVEHSQLALFMIQLHTYFWI